MNRRGLFGTAAAMLSTVILGIKKGVAATPRRRSVNDMVDDLEYFVRRDLGSMPRLGWTASNIFPKTKLYMKAMRDTGSVTDFVGQNFWWMRESFFRIYMDIPDELKTVRVDVFYREDLRPIVTCGHRDQARMRGRSDVWNLEKWS